MSRAFTCILCPNGCDMEAEIADGVLVGLTGSLCPKGREYVEQELNNPLRNIATSVLVEGGELPLCSVRLTKPIPKARIFDVIAEINKLKLVAPLELGQVVIPAVLGLDSDVITTKPVARAVRRIAPSPMRHNISL